MSTAPSFRRVETSSQLALPPSIETHVNEDYRGAQQGFLRIGAKDVIVPVMKTKKRAVALYLGAIAVFICSAALAISSGNHDIAASAVGMCLVVVPLAFSGFFVEAVETTRRRSEQRLRLEGGVCIAGSSSDGTPLAGRQINRRLDDAGGWLIEILLPDASPVLAAGLNFEESLAVERIVSSWVPA